MGKTPRINDYNAQQRDVYNQNRTHTGKRKMLTPGTRIALTLTAMVVFGVIGYLVVIVGFRSIIQLWTDLVNRTSEAQSLADIEFQFRIGWPSLKEWALILLWTGAWGLLFANYFKRNLEAQNAMNDKSDINEYEDDQYIATPDEIMGQYAFFPDMGAHADIQVSSLISHAMIQNKGIKKIQVAKRAKEDIKDEDGDVVYRKGEALEDDDGNIITEEVPMFDTDYAKKIFETSSVLDDYREAFDVRKVPYNPGKKTYGKLPYETAADLINGVWEYPEYEVQRPAGAYLVDTDPVNTMIIASTRAGKGQWFGPFTHLFHYQWGMWFIHMLTGVKSRGKLYDDIHV